MKILRTDDDRFDGLADFPYSPNYTAVDNQGETDLRMHYLDEGPQTGEIILCLHGQPTWSYLYRNMIPLLVEQGYRVIVPDFIGFGRSDKPAAREDYTYANHIHWLESFIERLQLDRLTLVAQDWGGLIGLRVLVRQPQRFSRVVISNTGLPDARGMAAEMAKPMREMFARVPALPAEEMSAMLVKNEMGAGFMYWIKHCSEYEDFKISAVMALSASSMLTEEQRRAYDAPFPSEAYKQGARQFPSLVPIFPDDPEVAHNREAWKVLAQFDKPFLTAFTDSDPVTAGAHVRFQKEVAGSQGQPHVVIKDAGHFVQEDAGPEFAGIITAFCSANPVL